MIIFGKYLAWNFKDACASELISGMMSVTESYCIIFGQFFYNNSLFTINLAQYAITYNKISN